MKNKLFLIKSLLVLFLISSCSSDDNSVASDFVVAFENPSVSFDASDTDKDITLVFSRPATENGTIDIKYTATNSEYGSDKDFTTNPAANAEGIITLNVNNGDTGATFKFNKLKNPIEGENKTVNFNISNIDFALGKIQGNTDLLVSFTETASLGGVVSPEVGGPNEPNQVFVDLSSGKTTAIKRDTWDLGFYNGDDFRVVINGSIFMGVAQLDKTDINAVTESDVTELQPLIATRVAGSSGYFDDPTGDMKNTAIAEISENDDENKVYLLKLGYSVSTKTAKVGSVELTGDLRGWKKIRILRSGNDYVMQYADLNDTEFKEVTISKKPEYNFTFYNILEEKVVDVQPEAKKWDICFAPFTNILDFGGGQSGAYGYSDYIVNNRLGGTKAYMVSTDDFAYQDFTIANVEDDKFIDDQRTIGSEWRSVFTKSVKTDRFFVLQDTDGNLYKINFTALVNESGERGHPKFEYELLK